MIKTPAAYTNTDTYGEEATNLARADIERVPTLDSAANASICINTAANAEWRYLAEEVFGFISKALLLLRRISIIPASTTTFACEVGDRDAGCDGGPEHDLCPSSDHLAQIAA